MAIVIERNGFDGMVAELDDPDSHLSKASFFTFWCSRQRVRCCAASSPLSSGIQASCLPSQVSLLFSLLFPDKWSPFSSLLLCFFLSFFFFGGVPLTSTTPKSGAASFSHAHPVGVWVSLTIVLSLRPVWVPEDGSYEAWAWLLGWIYGAEEQLPENLVVEVLVLADHFDMQRPSGLQQSGT